jgi:hypothetical protein
MPIRARQFGRRCAVPRRNSKGWAGMARAHAFSARARPVRLRRASDPVIEDFSASGGLQRGVLTKGRDRKSAARTLGRFRFAARRLRCRRRAWRRGNGPAKHLDSIAVSIKLTQCHYVCDGDILAFLIETVFAARIEACCSILGNDISQCGYSPLMSGDYDASAHFGVSISHAINMGAREAGRHGK